MTIKFGFNSWLLFLEQEKPITEGWLGVLQNSSLSGLVTQSLFPFCVANGHPTKTGSAIITITSILLITAAVWVSRTYFKRALEADGRAIDLPVALFALLSVFLNPFAWEHYYALLIAPLFIVTTHCWQVIRTMARRWGDHTCSTASMAVTACLALTCAGAFAFVFRALGRNIWEIFRHIEVWRRTPLPAFHWHVHYLQVLNFAPWIITILVCFAVMRLKTRLSIVD